MEFDVNKYPHTIEADTLRAMTDEEVEAWLEWLAMCEDLQEDR